MQGGGGIKDAGTGRPLEQGRPRTQMHRQFPTFIGCRIGKKNRTGNIGAKRPGGQLHMGGIGMDAILHAGFITRQQRRGEPLREREIAKFAAAHQRIGDELHRFGIKRVGGIGLTIVLRLMRRIGEAAIDKCHSRSDIAEACDLTRFEKTRNLKKHGAPPDGFSKRQISKEWIGDGISPAVSRAR